MVYKAHVDDLHKKLLRQHQRVQNAITAQDLFQDILIKLNPLFQITFTHKVLDSQFM